MRSRAPPTPHLLPLWMGRKGGLVRQRLEFNFHPSPRNEKQFFFQKKKDREKEGEKEREGEREILGRVGKASSMTVLSSSLFEQVFKLNSENPPLRLHSRTAFRSRFAIILVQCQTYD